MVLVRLLLPISFVKHEITLSNILNDERTICVLGKLSLLEIVLQIWQLLIS